MAETICPICFTIYAAGAVDGPHPFCPECGSEALDIEVVPIGQFLAENSLPDLEKRLEQWERQEGFLPGYKAQKTERIEEVIKRKRRLAGRLG